MRYVNKICFSTLALVGCAGAGRRARSRAAAQQKPNIVVFWGDDIG